MKTCEFQKKKTHIYFYLESVDYENLIYFYLELFSFMDLYIRTLN